MSVPKKLSRRGMIIHLLSRYRAYYDKGIAVLAVIRNMELSDLGILMAAAKYLFGDHLSTGTIIFLGCCYWFFNVIVNLSVGWFWERNDGWRIEAQVFGQRCQPTRTVLVDPDGRAYGARDIGGEVYGHMVKAARHGRSVREVDDGD